MRSCVACVMTKCPNNVSRHSQLVSEPELPREVRMVDYHFLRCLTGALGLYVWKGVG